MLKDMKFLRLTLILVALAAALPLNAATAAPPTTTRVKLSNNPFNSDWSIISPTWTFVSGKADGSGVSTLSARLLSTASFPSDRAFSVNFKTVIQGSLDYYSAWVVGKYDTDYNKTVVILHNLGVLEVAVSELGSTGLVDDIYTTHTSLSNLSFHQLTAVYAGNTVKVSIDGVLYLTVTDSILGALGASRVGLYSWGNSESEFHGATITF